MPRRQRKSTSDCRHHSANHDIHVDDGYENTLRKPPVLRTWSTNDLLLGRSKVCSWKQIPCAIAGLTLSSWIPLPTELQALMQRRKLHEVVVSENRLFVPLSASTGTPFSICPIVVHESVQRRMLRSGTFPPRGHHPCGRQYYRQPYQQPGGGEDDNKVTPCSQNKEQQKLQKDPQGTEGQRFSAFKG